MCLVSFVGDLLKAAEHLESFYNLTKGRLWQTDNGENLHSLSCGHLRRVYTTMSEKVNLVLYNHLAVYAWIFCLEGRLGILEPLSFNELSTCIFCRQKCFRANGFNLPSLGFCFYL